MSFYEEFETEKKAKLEDSFFTKDDFPANIKKKLDDDVIKAIRSHQLKGYIINKYVTMKELGARIYPNGSISSQNKNYIRLKDIMSCTTELQIDNFFHRFIMKMYD